MKPPQEEVVVRKLVRPAQPSSSPSHAYAQPSSSGFTSLSCFDCVTAPMATVRAWGFSGAGCIDAAALEAALQHTVTDVPALGGRLGGMSCLRLGTLRVEHTGAGALFTVADCRSSSTTLAAAMGADEWPQEGVTAQDLKLPFYVSCMDTGRRLLAGKEPLLNVRLTRLADGDVLALTVCHALLDGMRWPALMRHLAARYRQQACGAPPAPEDLLQPGDRKELSLDRYLWDAGLEGWQPPPSVRVRGSLAAYLRLPWALLRSRRDVCDIAILHLPQSGVARIKAAAAAGNPAVTTGDAVQAAAALLLHAAQGKPLLPVAPKAMTVMVLMPVSSAFFGNAVRMLEASLPAGTPQPAAGDGDGALHTLAGAIRAAVAHFRTDKAEPALALAEAEAYAAAPLPRLFCHLSTSELPRWTAATNYVPAVQKLELGLGRPPAFSHPLSYPRSPGMAIIRPAAPPYSDGLFVSMCLPRKAAAALRRHPLLPALLPEARWVGGDGGQAAQ